jgi:hypothetical protein
VLDEGPSINSNGLRMNRQSNDLTLTVFQLLYLFIAAFTVRQSLVCFDVVLILFREQLNFEFAHAAI